MIAIVVAILVGVSLAFLFRCFLIVSVSPDYSSMEASSPAEELNILDDAGNASGVEYRVEGSMTYVSVVTSFGEAGQFKSNRLVALMGIVGVVITGVSFLYFIVTNPAI